MSAAMWTPFEAAVIRTEFVFTRWGAAASPGRYFVCVIGGSAGGFFLPREAVVDDFGNLVAVS